MAEATKQNPARAAEKAPDASESSNGTAEETKGKAPALYHIYTTDDDAKTLTFVKDVTAKTAEAAVTMAVKSDQKLVGKTLVVTPQRNLKVFSTEVKTTTRVKVSAA